jgi:acetolactate synthase small subunit
MQAFHIHYRNTQGTLMRILNAASRRGLDLASVQAEPAEHDHRVTLVLEVNSKQVGQLCREWYAVADVTDVRSSASVCDHAHAARAAEWSAPHPPASANVSAPSARAALA